MKATEIWASRLVVFAALACPLVQAQYVKLDRCEPATIRPGVPTEIRLHGGGLERGALWTSFPAKVEVVDEKALKFRITTEHVGAGAIRVHSENGVSNLVFVTAAAIDNSVVASENRTRSADAQAIPTPIVVEGATPNLGSHFFRFAGKSGQGLEISATPRGSSFDGVLTIRSVATGRRLVQVDDSEITGADPWIEFVPPSDGDFEIELSDTQYRGGLGYRVTIKAAEKRAPASSGGNSVPAVSDNRISGVLTGENDLHTISFNVPERSFYTITPYTRAIRSPVTPRLRLTDPDGKVLAETPSDSFEERPLRVWIEKGMGYQLTITDAFGGAGSYQIELDDDTIPYELSIPGQREKKHPLPDKFLAVPGGTFVVPVQVRRHQFEEVIELQLTSEIALTSDDKAVAKGKGNMDLRVRLPQDAVPGSLLTLRVSGASRSGEKSYEQSLKTREVLQERDGDADIPDEVDGALAVRIIESPVTVKISPPDEVAKGSKVNVPVKITWRDEKRKFNTTLRLIGLPGGVHSSEKKLNTKDTSTELELKVDNPGEEELKNLRVEVRLDYHKQALAVESAPFTVKLTEKNEKED